MKQERRYIQDDFKPAVDIVKAIGLSGTALLKQLPVAVCVCDISGTITEYNLKAVELWGRAPQPGDTCEHFFNEFKLFQPDGKLMSADERPSICWFTAEADRRDYEMIIEKKDLSRLWIKVNVVPVKNDQDEVVGLVECFNDITAERKQEKDLEIKSKELQDYIDNAAIGLHWVDANGIIKWANKTELKMLGYSREEYVGHHINEFHTNDEKITDILTRLSKNETLKNYETEVLCKDGSTRTVQISSNVLWEDGKFIHTRCFSIDVTEEKKLFQALKQSESQYQQVLASLHAPVYTTDKEGRITLYNKAAATLWGREPEIGKDLWCGSYKIFNADGSVLPLDSCPMAVTLKEGRPVLGHEIVVVRPDGSLRNVCPYPQPIFDEAGKLVGAVNLLIDITEIKRSEQALRESEKQLRELMGSLENKVDERTADLKAKNEELKRSEERYHRMIEEVEDYAIVLLDENGIIQNWNRGAERIKGYREEEIVGKNFSHFYLQEDRKRGLPQRLLSEAREKGKAIHEGWRLRKDGSFFWGSIVITALHDSEGNVVGFSKVTRDLTERKAAEDKSRDYMHQLEFQNRELEQFAFAASHDMKEPLRKINFYYNFIAQNALMNLDERSQEYLNRSIAAVARMSTLIDDLLAYSKTASTHESFEETDLNEIFEDIVLSHKDLMEEQEVDISLAHMPTISAIPFQLKQLMDNLINNSIKYKHPNRKCLIEITCDRMKGWQIDLPEADNRLTYHKISVIDNGIGFEAQYAEKIFEVFQRLNSKSAYKGSGIGLAICKKIVLNHNGIIKASGKLNEGARFDVYIPLQ